MKLEAKARRFRTLAVASRWLCIGLLVSNGAGAVETREFVTSNAADYEEGTLSGLGVTSDGVLVLSPSKILLAPNVATYVWRLAEDSSGRIYAATGSEGRLFVLGRDGGAIREVESHEYELFAVALDGKGRGFLAGAPNGTILLLPAPDGEPRTLFDVPEGIVWALVVGDDGTLYAATGERGRIYSIAEDGRATVLYQSPETHIVSLAWGPGGRLLAGTDREGRLLAIDPRTGEGTVLFDSPQEEVAEILVDAEGSILFAANGSQQSPSPSGSENEDEFMLKVGPVADGPILYRATADGIVSELWRCPEQDILSLAEGEAGTVWVGTGSKGILFRVYPDGRSERAAAFDENQVLSLLRSDRGLLVGTGNGGALYRLESKGQVVGEYTSKVHDAGGTSRWGTPHLSLRMTAGADLVLQTRSGATSDVGEGWSEWETADLAAGAGLSSPPNRFLQWRLEVTSSGPLGIDGPLVYEVVIPYLRPNRPPRITKVFVSPGSPQPGSEKRQGPVTQILPGGIQVDYTLQEGAKRNSAGVVSVDEAPWARVYRSVVWEVDDPDGDRLLYDIAFRPEGEATWTVLGKDVETNGYTWDSSAWPDGRYMVRVEAADSPDNPEAWTLRSSAESLPFEIDNTPPVLREIRAAVVTDDGKKSLRVSGRAEDSASRIARIEVSIDGKGWVPIASSDGILDSRIETFEGTVAIEGQEEPRFVAVRVRDEAGHGAVARAVIAP